MKNNTGRDSLQETFFWLTTPEFAVVKRVTVRAVQKSIKNGRYGDAPKPFLNPDNGQQMYKLPSWLLSASEREQYWRRKFPEQIQEEKIVTQTSSAGAPALEDQSTETLLLATAKPWQRDYAAYWLELFRETTRLRGKELRSALEQWNQRHGDFKQSIRNLKRMRRLYETGGITELLPRWNWRTGKTAIPRPAFEYFKKAYLTERGVSLKEAWIETLAYYHDQHDRKTSIDNFPTPQAFYYQLLHGKDSLPVSAIYLARYGQRSYNKKFANYVDRDFSEVRSGDVWVCDHAQLDACAMINGRAVFPWVTAWSDFKSRKRLSWFLHAEAPQSDHIFQSMQMAIEKHGLPEVVYVDNGKDYRCKDFSGGKKIHRVEFGESEHDMSLLRLLGVEARFAIPFNAQTKNIERDFRMMKEMFAARLPGYRGGNVTERPEKLKKEIHRGEVYDFETLEKCLAEAVEWMNANPSQGKVHAGRSANQIWSEERTKARFLSNEAMMLMFMRSKTVTIGRNGAMDSEIGKRYWGEWMEAVKGEKVILRRNPAHYETAYCFSATDGSYLGEARIGEMTAPALAKTSVQKQQLAKAYAAKKRAFKKAHELARVERLDPIERLRYRKAGALLLNRGEVFDEPAPVRAYKLTTMDDVARKVTKNKKNQPVEEVKKEQIIYQFAWQKRAAEGE